MFPAAAQSISLSHLATYESGVFDDGAAEIVAHDPGTQRLFFINGGAATVDVVGINDPANPTFLFSIDITPYGDHANSVAVHDGLVAAAVENDDAQAPGSVVFFDADGAFLNQLTVGALPDMITFTPDGNTVLVANEGEPDDDYLVDPEGSVSIISVANGVAGLTDADVRTAGFTAFNGAVLDESIRIFGPGATVAQDLEPEYIAVSDNSRRAWVVLQENNAVAAIDIARAVVTDLWGLGFKDHSLGGNGLDASNEDGGINITPWPVHGMYLPDGIAFLSAGRGRFLLTANEGDSRDYDGFSEEERIEDLVLDPGAFPDAAELQLEENLGRLKVTATRGDTDGDGDYDALYSFGARSFSVWDAVTGALVYDSGDAFEQVTAALFPDDFNSTDNENGSFDDRSDDKGPEPEGIVVGSVGGRTYAFIGLERMSGVMVYDVTVPQAPEFVEYVNNRDYSGDPEAGTAGDLAPEGLHFIAASESPTGVPLLVASHEVSGTVTIYEVNMTGAARPFAAKGGPQEGDQPAQFVLGQNYPNPFNPETTIDFQLPQDGLVTLRVYNLLGREVQALVNTVLDAGTYSVRWDGRDAQGNPVASGTYLYRLEAGNAVHVRSMVLIK